MCAGAEEGERNFQSSVSWKIRILVELLVTGCIGVLLDQAYSLKTTIKEKKHKLERGSRLTESGYYSSTEMPKIFRFIAP